MFSLDTAVQELSFRGTFAPVKRSLHKQLSCPLTFAPVELSLPYLKKLWKAAKQCFHRHNVGERSLLFTCRPVRPAVDSASPS